MGGRRVVGSLGSRQQSGRHNRASAHLPGYAMSMSVDHDVLRRQTNSDLTRRRVLTAPPRPLRDLSIHGKAATEVARLSVVRRSVHFTRLACALSPAPLLPSVSFDSFYDRRYRQRIARRQSFPLRYTFGSAKSGRGRPVYRIIQTSPPDWVSRMA